MSIVPLPNFCASISDPTLCGHCLRGNRFYLHHVPIHHTCAYVCTSCVLRLYPQLFCPTCFEVYQSPTEENVVICSECCRSTHFQCVRPKSPDPYICAACVDPNSLIFVDSDLVNVGMEDFRKKEKKGGMIFFTATMLIAVLTRKAADVARVVADEKAALAALAKKKVMEAFEYLSNTHGNENLTGMRVDELASKPANELGSNNVVGSYNSHGRGAGRGRGRGAGRGRAAGYTSRGRGVGRGGGRVRGLDAGGSSCGRGGGRVLDLVAGGSIRGRGARGGHGRVRGLAASDSDSDYNPDSDSDSDYVGSSRTCKRRYTAKNTDTLSL